MCTPREEIERKEREKSLGGVYVCLSVSVSLASERAEADETFIIQDGGGRKEKSSEEEVERRRTVQVCCDKMKIKDLVAVLFIQFVKLY